MTRVYFIAKKMIIKTKGCGINFAKKVEGRFGWNEFRNSFLLHSGQTNWGG